MRGALSCLAPSAKQNPPRTSGNQRKIPAGMRRESSTPAEPGGDPVPPKFPHPQPPLPKRNSRRAGLLPTPARGAPWSFFLLFFKNLFCAGEQGRGVVLFVFSSYFLVVNLGLFFLLFFPLSPGFNALPAPAAPQPPPPDPFSSPASSSSPSPGPAPGRSSRSIPRSIHPSVPPSGSGGAGGAPGAARGPAPLPGGL